MEKNRRLLFMLPKAAAEWRKPMKKSLCLILSVLMLAALATGCQNSVTQSGPTPSAPGVSGSAPTPEASDVTYPIKGNVKLTLAIGEESPVTVTSAFADTPFVKAWEKATGVTLEISHPADFALLFASGNLPDMIHYTFSSYNGGMVQAVADKIIYPINDLIDQNAPDLKAVLESNEIYRKVNSTPNGDIVGFPFIRGDELLVVSMGLIIRQDWLDDLKLESPATPEEFYNVLKAFKDQKGATAPFSPSNWGLHYGMIEEGAITTPFNLPQAAFYQKDGTVHYGYYESEYKEVLYYLNKLYNEGLLDPNFATIDNNTVNSNFMNGISGATVGAVGGGIGNYLSTMEGKDPKFNVSAVGSLVSKRGDTAMSGQYDNPIYGIATVITTACKNKEAAAQFLNYGYTEEGSKLFNFGIEGESYTMVNDVPTYTDLITKNPNGLTMQQALAQYCRAWNNGGFVQDAGYIKQYAGRPQQQAALQIWSNTDAVQYNMPAVTIATEDSARYSRLSGDIGTYISEMRTKFISGLEPLSNFDTYLATLKEMGIEDMIGMMQKALDEFNAR